jgi:hypothetical protein
MKNSYICAYSFNQMKNLTFFLALLLFPAIFQGQSTSATATTIIPVAYLDATPGVPTLSNYALVASSSQTFYTCPGNQDVYWLKFNIPVPPLNVNSTRSVKITVNSSAFTPTIDFFDNAVVWKQCVTGTIMRTNPTTNTVLPGQDYYIRVSGTDGVAGETFSIGVEFYPTTEIAAAYTPSPDADGYTVCEQIRRALVAVSGSSLVQATRIRIVPTSSPNNGECTATVGGTTSILNTTNFSCACYNTSYNAFAEVQVDGHWCGESISKPIFFQVGPSTNITTANNQIIPFLNSINCAFACGNNNFQWEFSTTNGLSLQPQPPSSSTSLQLTTALGLRFNRVYQARVQLTSTGACSVTGEWCGLNGPNSTPLTLFTEQMPVLEIPPQYCNTVLPANTYIDIDFAPGVEQYWFQFVRVSPTAPYSPIAVPKLVNSNSSSGAFLYQGSANTSGNTYRVCAKPLIVSNNNQQQGSWGPYCYYALAPASAPSVGMIQQNSTSIEFQLESEEGIFTEDLVSGQVVFTGSQRILNIDLGENSIANTGHIEIYDIQGKLVYQDVLPFSTGVNIIQRELPSSMTSGIYIYKVYSDRGATNGKFSLASN